MKKIRQLCALGLLLETVCVHADFGPNGMNQWQLISNLNYCLRTNLDSVYSKLELLIDNSSSLSILDNFVSTLDPFLAQIQSSNISNFDLIASQSDLCCNTLSALDVALQSDITIIATKTDSLASAMDFWGTTIVQQNTILNSDLDVCCSTLDTLLLSINSTVSTIDAELDALTGSTIEEVTSLLENLLVNLQVATALTNDVDANIAIMSDQLESVIDAISVLEI